MARLFQVGLLCTSLLSLVGSLRSADPKESSPSSPTVVLQLQPLDTLLNDFNYLASFSAQKEQAKQLEQLVRTQIGDKGLLGFDVKKPLGAYLVVGNELTESSLALLVPVADEAALLAALELFGQKVEKDKDGLYSVKTDNKQLGMVYFRFAHQYAYISAREKSLLSKEKILPPEKVFADEKSLACLTIHAERLPVGLRKFALNQVELQFALEKEKRGTGESKAQHELKHALLDDIFSQILALANDAKQIRAEVRLDRTKERFVSELRVVPKPDTGLAKSLVQLGQAQTLFAGAASKDASLSQNFTLPLPEKFHKALAPVIDEAFKKELAREQDAEKKALGEKLFKQLGTMLKVGEVAGLVEVFGPNKDKQHTLLLGVKVKEGKPINEVLREVHKALPAEAQQFLQFAADKAGTDELHKLTLGSLAPIDFQELFGTAPVYFLFRDDTAWVALGPDGLAKLKQAATAKPTASKIAQGRLSYAQLTHILNKKQPELTKLAEQLLTKPGSDELRLTAESGKELHITLEAALPFLGFLQKAGEVGK